MIIGQVHDSISLSSSQRMVFSSIRSFTSGNRFDFSVSSSTESVPLQSSSSICSFSVSSSAISFSSCFVIPVSLLKSSILALLVQADTGCFFFLWFLRLLLLLEFGFFPVTIIAVITGKVTNISLSVEYQQVVDHFIHKVAVVRNDMTHPLKFCKYSSNTFKVIISRSFVGSSSTRKFGLRISTVQ